CLLHSLSHSYVPPLHLHSFLHDALPISSADTRSMVLVSFCISTQLKRKVPSWFLKYINLCGTVLLGIRIIASDSPDFPVRNSFRSEEHTSELQSQSNLVCRLLLEKKNT